MTVGSVADQHQPGVTEKLAWKFMAGYQPPSSNGKSSSSPLTPSAEYILQTNHLYIAAIK